MKIEKLELKHICGYLPHDLVVYTNRGTRYYLGVFSNMCGIGIETREISTVLEMQYKPLLLPLSALTELLPDGTVPIEEMYELFGSKSGFGKLFYQSDLLESLKRGVNETKHKHVEYLYSKHFDIYGLIDAGLAIDKRTVKL